MVINLRRYSRHGVSITNILLPCPTNLFLVNINIDRCCHLTDNKSSYKLLGKDQDNVCENEFNRDYFSRKHYIKTGEIIYQHVQLKTYEIIKQFIIHFVKYNIYLLFWNIFLNWLTHREHVVTSLMKIYPLICHLTLWKTYLPEF